MTEQDICHVCKSTKENYLVVLDDNMLSLIQYEEARVKGPICKRCNDYYSMTGEFKDATDDEFRYAKEAVKFSKAFSDWWWKDEKMKVPESEDDLYDEAYANNRDWPGTVEVKKFFREWVKKHEMGKR